MIRPRVSRRSPAVLGLAFSLLLLAALPALAQEAPPAAAQDAPAATAFDATDPRWVPGVPVVQRPIMSGRRVELAREYSLVHHGIDDWKLEGPLAVVVHFTGTDSLAGSLGAFMDDELPSSRPDIAAGGRLNVGVHYVIARDGTVYALMPEYAMGRHTIGYNRVSLGIELVGSRPGSLTAAQLDACAALVADMAARHPGMRYLFGHHEYEEAGRAHAVLRLELLQGYAPTVKIDPGAAFMASLRERLKARFSLEFLD